MMWKYSKNIKVDIIIKEKYQEMGFGRKNGIMKSKPGLKNWLN